jgi:hypothetical protein
MGPLLNIWNVRFEAVITDFIFLLPTFLFYRVLYRIFTCGIMRAVKGKKVATVFMFSGYKRRMIQSWDVTACPGRLVLFVDFLVPMMMVQSFET